MSNKIVASLLCNYDAWNIAQDFQIKHGNGLWCIINQKGGKLIDSVKVSDEINIWITLKEEGEEIEDVHKLLAIFHYKYGITTLMYLCSNANFEQMIGQLGYETDIPTWERAYESFPVEQYVRGEEDNCLILVIDD